MKRLLLQLAKISFFFFAIQFLVGLIFLALNFSSENLMRMTIISIVTSLMLALILGVIQLIHLKTDKISINEYDMNPSQTALFVIDKPIDESKQIIEKELPIQINSYEFIYNKERNIYTAKTGATIRSWGEKIIINLKEIENFKTQISVTSKPIFVTTLIDYGKSLQNIKKIKLAFDKTA